MPELAEVEYYRNQWNAGLRKKVVAVDVHSGSRIFRGASIPDIRRCLPGSTLSASLGHGKQMLFRFSTGNLGIHLGMTGELRLEAPGFTAGKHDHLVLHQKEHSLVFSDPRHFGRVRFNEGKKLPAWWTALPPGLLSTGFSVKTVAAFCSRRRGAPIKAVILMQEQFPGIGNWMADEILWRAAIHPRRHAGSLSPSEIQALWKETRYVAKRAMAIIGKDWSDLPDDWLFNHRWKKGGRCPRTGVELIREAIGGRTTCWSPGRQKIKAAGFQKKSGA